jgi:cobalt-precorrin 5A hydrolase
VIVVGIGCRREVSAAAIVALAQDAAARIAATLELLAAPEFRYAEAGIAEAAVILGLPIRWIAHAALKGEQGRCVTRSVRAEAEVGLASVAEAAALAAAGPDSRLILPRIAGGGVTLALAEGPGAA